MIQSAPQAALTARQPLILVHGTYRIQASDFPPDARLRLVALDQRTKQEYAGGVGQRDASPDVPPPKTSEPPAETLQRMVITGYFNTDLVATVKLPWASAIYRIHAELAGNLSNEITIQVTVS